MQPMLEMTNTLKSDNVKKDLDICSKKKKSECSHSIHKVYCHVVISQKSCSTKNMKLMKFVLVQ